MTDDTPTRLGRIEEKLDSLLERQKEDREANVKRLDNHGERIGSLERWQSRVLGAVAVAAFFLGSTIKTLLGK